MEGFVCGLNLPGRRRPRRKRIEVDTGRPVREGLLAARELEARYRRAHRSKTALLAKLERPDVGQRKRPPPVNRQAGQPFIRCWNKGSCLASVSAGGWIVTRQAYEHWERTCGTHAQSDTVPVAM